MNIRIKNKIYSKKRKTIVKNTFNISFFLTGVLALSLYHFSFANQSSSGPVHALSFHDTPKYADNFEHYNFASPNAKKGDELRLISIGTFDCINKTYKCTKVDGLNLIQDSLMSRSLDEPFSLYTLVAEKATLSNDYSWIEFKINPKAKWHDGSSITPEDVIFSLEIQSEKGFPFLQSIYSQVEKVEKTAKDTVKFTFKKGIDGYNRELPLIICMMGLYSKKYYTENILEFDKPTLIPFLTSGPYRIKKTEPGRYIIYERVPHYWAKNLPVNIGRYNFDTVRYDYYRDSNAAFQAFKSGNHDIYRELSPQNWNRNHKGLNYDKGLIKKIELENNQPVGLRGFSFNTRNTLFQDKRVRQAIILAFDRSFITKSILPGFKPNNSYFDNTDLAAPEVVTPEEIALLKEIAPEINALKLTNHAKNAYKQNTRQNRRQAIALLKQAGWNLKKGILTNDKTGNIFEFELVVSGQDQQKIALAFARNMKNIGIKASVVLVDAAQYEHRKQSRSYDMLASWWATSLSPGRELQHYWSCSAKDNSGSRNYPGICSTVSDILIESVSKSISRKKLRTITHALDRILMNEAYLVPLFFNPKVAIAMSQKIHYKNSTTNPMKDSHFWWSTVIKNSSLKPSSFTKKTK